MPPSENVAAPGWLSPEARAKYEELCPQLLSVGVMSDLDVDALARYSHAWVEYQRHAAICAAGGDVLTLYADDGRIKFQSVSPSATLVDKHSRTLLRIGAEFGMTPSSRTSVAAKAGPKGDPLQAWLERYNAKEGA